MSSSRYTDSALREYLLRHSLPQIFKALLTGLCVSCPESPLHFLEEKILAIQENRDTEIEWYACIDDFDKGWKSYLWNIRAEEARMLRRMEAAWNHHVQRERSIALRKWRKWLKIRKQRKNDAVKKIQKVWNAVLCKTIIGAWRYVVQDAKRIREYFEIFHCLGIRDLFRCAQVCRTWKAIARTSSLWAQINFCAERHWIADQTVERILGAYSVFVTHLNMRGCVSLRSSSFRCISKLLFHWQVCFRQLTTILFSKDYCSNLQDLNVSECISINDQTMHVILEACRSLLHLDLSYTSITNATLMTLSRCCEVLQSLSLAYCRSFTDKGLMFLATGKHCHKLNHLDLSGCLQITVDGFRYVAEGCSLLRQIVFDDMPTLSDGCIKQLISKCHSLEMISFVDSNHLSDTAFLAITKVSRLRTLKTEGNRRMTDVSWRALCKSSPKLQLIHAVDCPGLTDTAMKFIGALKHLTYFDISDCIRVSDHGLRNLAKGPSASKLCYLNLTNCCNINDLSILWLAQRCVKLRHLSLCYCESLTDNGMEWLGGCPSLVSLDVTGCCVQDRGLSALGAIDTLRKLTVSECVWITDIGIEKFCKQARCLEHLDVCHCVKLSDQSIKTLSFYCRTIFTLKIAGCPRMTNKAVKYLSGVGHYLKELDVSGCVHLTNRTVSFLLRGCPQLRSISMLYCSNISREAALQLRPCVQDWEHSTDDVPDWYGYDCNGKLFRPVPSPDRLTERREEEKALANSGKPPDGVPHEMPNKD
ncbi:dynein regulatory complex subunit 6 [Chanos chanos]|uniref:Dynein regulatory complex subunit 6 n=1 Tax=Chanos chanos TaxID=29144 RepID=A0A6J2WQW3_CHACN|nr:dynein regulatory complex subunit 6 [Chanos chanos]